MNIEADAELCLHKQSPLIMVITGSVSSLLYV